LIGANGEQVGVVSTPEARRLAEAEGLDLVEIVPTSSPPVCRIMDFGKFQYEQSKKRHAAKRKQKQIQVKEVKFRPGTDVGDYQVKLRNLIRFLESGDKAKITLRFRGREMAHQELGAQLLQRIELDLKEHAVVEQYPRMEGRQMVMVVSPSAKKVAGKGSGSAGATRPSDATQDKPPHEAVAAK
jgi:translation initiation factor IF-3